MSNASPTPTSRLNNNVIAFRPPGVPQSHPRRPGLTRAQFLESTMLLTDFARQMGLTITVHPQGDVA